MVSHAVLLYSSKLWSTFAYQTGGYANQVTDVLKISMIGKGKMMFSDEPINNDKRSSGNTHVQKSSPTHSSLLSVTRTASTDPPLPIEDEPSLEEIRSWRKHNGLLSTVLRIFGS
ncbi:hypothetical protein C345_05692 [Cryptococcus neoformans A2-102-5]|nr:hypothetical protein C346_05807 [Cryptococcus neoformans var. grubii D17-1]OXG92168.1 hypothetical protein C345_05692 [Cryptococcus neoformans var. grubii A2-102-5]